MTTSKNARALLSTAMMGALALGSTVWAGEGSDMFQQMDANKDGRISSQEHASGAAAMFARMDANKDGELMDGELMRMHHAMQQAHGMRGPDRSMAMMDANHDGEITAAEHAAGAAAMFARMDTNKDGRLKGDELQHDHGGMHRADKHAGMAEPHAKQHAKMDKDAASMPAMHHEGMEHQGMAKAGMAHGGMQHAGMAAMMDANHDGKLSAAEHTASAASMFVKVDADHDGFVTRAEFDAGMKAMHTP